MYVDIKEFVVKTVLFQFLNIQFLKIRTNFNLKHVCPDEL